METKTLNNNSNEVVEECNQQQLANNNPSEQQQHQQLELPVDVYVTIFSFLTLRDASIFSRTSTTLSDLFQSDALWYQLLFRDYCVLLFRHEFQPLPVTGGESVDFDASTTTDGGELDDDELTRMQWCAYIREKRQEGRVFTNEAGRQDLSIESLALHGVVVNQKRFVDAREALARQMHFLHLGSGDRGIFYRRRAKDVYGMVTTGRFIEKPFAQLSPSKKCGVVCMTILLSPILLVYNIPNMVRWAAAPLEETVKEFNDILNETNPTSEDAQSSTSPSSPKNKHKRTQRGWFRRWYGRFLASIAAPYVVYRLGATRSSGGVWKLLTKMASDAWNCRSVVTARHAVQQGFDCTRRGAQWTATWITQNVVDPVWLAVVMAYFSLCRWLRSVWLTITIVGRYLADVVARCYQTCCQFVVDTYRRIVRTAKAAWFGILMVVDLLNDAIFSPLCRWMRRVWHEMTTFAVSVAHATRKVAVRGSNAVVNNICMPVYRSFIVPLAVGAKHSGVFLVDKTLVCAQGLRNKLLSGGGCFRSKVIEPIKAFFIHKVLGFAYYLGHLLWHSVLVPSALELFRGTRYALWRSWRFLRMTCLGIAWLLYKTYRGGVFVFAWVRRAVVMAARFFYWNALYPIATVIGRVYRVVASIVLSITRVVLQVVSAIRRVVHLAASMFYWRILYPVASAIGAMYRAVMRAIFATARAVKAAAVASWALIKSVSMTLWRGISMASRLVFENVMIPVGSTIAFAYRLAVFEVTRGVTFMYRGVLLPSARAVKSFVVTIYRSVLLPSGQAMQQFAVETSGAVRRTCVALSVLVIDLGKTAAGNIKHMQAMVVVSVQEGAGYVKQSVLYVSALIFGGATKPTPKNTSHSR